ncbi:ankyrin repeat domain-containing protein SOWAHC [Triplophysa rosa]|uniref:Ankyrin repeat domain-containing protein SOWAHD n=1 Tax=Triplophysa rosa TaxID=992332 RepID=A0A9W7WJJ5_TRIRA|nr:ankyrin repeat domain-containing protein SOWAHC [Triplophysa rosa]KAI7801904.1 putative ankyrin repeat domain-containing protein SOWAHD [Triplophysa rosa]
MYVGASSGPVVSEEHCNPPSEEPEDTDCKDSGNAGSNSGSPKNRTTSQIRSSLEERLSRHGARPASPVFSASTRRSRFQKLELCEPGSSASQRLSVDASEKSTLTPAMRKKYLKELFLNNRSGLSSILSSGHSSSSAKDCEDALYGLNDTANSSAFWALDPMEHAWMLSAVDGNYDTMVEFLAEDPSLLSRKDFISGYTALHWLAKNGKDDALIRLLKHAETEGLPVNVNLRGSGGLTPLHVAAMHNQYMIVKILIGAFSANTEIMDYNGKRAWQYLKDNAPREMKELLGAWDDEHTVGYLNVNNNSVSEAQAIKHTQENKVEVDTSVGRTGWRFASFRRLLYNVGLLEEKS